MASILILYSTTDGHTLRICQRIEACIKAAGHGAVLMPIVRDTALDWRAFDKIVIAARIRYGHHHPEVFAFVRAHLDALAHVPSAFFSVNTVARKPERSQPETNPYVRSFFAKTPWRPQLVDVFAGKLDYPRYGFFDRQIIRFIMWLMDGPTDPSGVFEFTDWARVDAFAQKLCVL